MTKVKCCWCGWHGFNDELDFDAHDIPCYCPVYGHDSYIMELEGDEGDDDDQI